MANPMSPDHRSSTRFPVELAAAVRWKGPAGNREQAKGKTLNISGNGVLLSVPVRLRPETPINFTVYLPPEITGTPIELVGQGRVVRGGRVGELDGIAVIIDEYQLQASEFCA